MNERVLDRPNGRCTVKLQSSLDGSYDFMSWCGNYVSKMEWHFVDVQHLVQSVGGSIQPCKKCVKMIIKELEKEL